MTVSLSFYGSAWFGFFWPDQTEHHHLLSTDTFVHWTQAFIDIYLLHGDPFVFMAVKSECRIALAAADLWHCLPSSVSELEAVCSINGQLRFICLRNSALQPFSTFFCFAIRRHLRYPNCARKSLFYRLAHKHVCLLKWKCVDCRLYLWNWNWNTLINTMISRQNCNTD